MSACCGRFRQPGFLLKTENDFKLCLSTWVTLCPNMAERSGLENSTRPLVLTSVSVCRASEYFDFSTEN